MTPTGVPWPKLLSDVLACSFNLRLLSGVLNLTEYVGRPSVVPYNYDIIPQPRTAQIVRPTKHVAGPVVCTSFSDSPLCIDDFKAWKVL